MRLEKKNSTTIYNLEIKYIGWEIGSKCSSFANETSRFWKCLFGHTV